MFLFHSTLSAVISIFTYVMNKPFPHTFDPYLIGFPLLLYPPTLIVNIIVVVWLYLPITCQYRAILLLVNFLNTGAICLLSRIYSFLIFSTVDTIQIHLNIRIYDAFIFSHPSLLLPPFKYIRYDGSHIDFINFPLKFLLVVFAFYKT